VEADSLALVSAALAAGLLAGYGVAVPVGAVGTYLLGLTARTSLKIGACAALGVASADGLYAAVAALGGTTLAREIRPIMPSLRWASVCVLLILAIRGAVTAVSRYRKRQSLGAAASDMAAPTRPVRAFLGLLGMTLLNPTTVIYFGALVLGAQAAASVSVDRLKQLSFVVGAFVASASWQLLLAGGGALLGSLLAGARGRLLTALASSAVVTFLAVRLLVAG
jgi:arginine exporter protein ArgO